MFGLFKRKRGGDETKPSLDAVRFDTSGYEFRGELQRGMVRAWYTPEGDGIGLYFFPLPPDLPANCAAEKELIAYYEQMIGGSGGKLVEARVIEAGGCSVVHTILSVPQQPSGRIYVGSLTIPFQDFSFVVKCQCAEGEIIGVKAALLLDQFLEANEDNEAINVDTLQFPIPGFDPDDSKYDAGFPQDPVARARRVLAHIATTLTVAEGVRAMPGFGLPQHDA